MWDNSKLAILIERDKKLREYKNYGGEYTPPPMGDGIKATCKYDPASDCERVCVSKDGIQVEGQYQKTGNNAEDEQNYKRLLMQLLQMLQRMLEQNEEARQKGKAKRGKPKDDDKEEDKKKKEEDWMEVLKRGLTDAFSAAGFPHG